MLQWSMLDVDKTDESIDIGDFDENLCPSRADSDSRITAPSPSPPDTPSLTARPPRKASVSSPASRPEWSTESPTRAVKHGIEEAFLNARSKTESDVRLWNCYQSRLPKDPASSLTVTVTSTEAVYGTLYCTVAESPTLLLTFPTFQKEIVTGNKVRVDPPWRERNLGTGPWRVITAAHYYRLIDCEGTTDTCCASHE